MRLATYLETNTGVWRIVSKTTFCAIQVPLFSLSFGATNNVRSSVVDKRASDSFFHLRLWPFVPLKWLPTLSDMGWFSFSPGEVTFGLYEMKFITSKNGTASSFTIANDTWMTDSRIIMWTVMVSDTVTFWLNALQDSSRSRWPILSSQLGLRNRLKYDSNTPQCQINR